MIETKYYTIKGAQGHEYLGLATCLRDSGYYALEGNITPQKSITSIVDRETKTTLEFNWRRVNPIIKVSGEAESIKKFETRAKDFGKKTLEDITQQKVKPAVTDRIAEATA